MLGTGGVPSSLPAIQPHESELQRSPIGSHPHKTSLSILSKKVENQRAVINANQVSSDVYSVSASIQEFEESSTGVGSYLLSEVPSPDGGTWKEIHKCPKVYFHYASTSDNKEQIGLSSYERITEIFSLLEADPVHYYYLGDLCFIQL